MPSYIGSPYVIRPRVYDPDAERFFSAVRAGGSRVSEQRQRLYDDLIRRLKLGGIWSLLDVLYVLAAADATAALINVRNPGTFNATAVNSPTFTVDRGYTGNGTTSYLDSNFNPATAGGQFQLNAATLSVRSLTEGQENHTMAGNYNAGNQCVIIGRGWLNADNFGSRINASSGGTILANASAVGLFTCVRSNSSSAANYLNGALLGSQAQSSTALASDNICVARRGQNGDYSAKQFASLQIGGALSDAQVAALHAAELAYMQAVGAA